MQINEKVSVIEAILFASGEAIEIDRLAESCGVEQDDALKLIQLLNDRYDKVSSALRVLKLGEKYQLTTRKDFSPYIQLALEKKRETPLSNAALEVLAIVAYNQPVTKSFIEHVRGVDSTGVVANLVEREMLEEAGRLDVPGKPISYRTSANFLRCFELSSLADLPPLPSNEEQVSFDDIEP